MSFSEYTINMLQGFKIFLRILFQEEINLLIALFYLPEFIQSFKVLLQDLIVPAE